MALRKDGETGGAKASSWMILVVLMITLLIAQVDKGIISVLADPIKEHLSISDTKLGLLQSLSFLVIFAVFGVVAGVLVDRFSRTRLLACAVFFWSAMTSLCGLAHSFLTLGVVRSGVALGESVLHPAAYSLIGDIFGKEKQGLAIGLYAAAAPIGVGLSVMVGGGLLAVMESHGPMHLPGIGEMQPWQMTVAVLGIPGVIMAGVLALIRDPHRGGPVVSAREPVWKAFARSDVRNFYRTHSRTVLLHHAGMVMSAVVVHGTMAWQAPMFIRSYGLGYDEMGVLVGNAVLIAGFGVFCGGVTSDCLYRRYGATGRVLVCVAGVAGSLAIGAVYPMFDNKLLAAVGLCLTMTLCGFVVSGGTTMLQHIAPSTAKGTVQAVFLLFNGLLGAIGPVVVGLFSDNVFVSQDGVRNSLATVAALFLGGSLMAFVLVIRPYRTSCRTVAELEPGA